MPTNEPAVVSPDMTQPCAAPGSRKPYATPVLEALGDVRDLTLGGSAGSGESGRGGGSRKSKTGRNG